MHSAGFSKIYSKPDRYLKPDRSTLNINDIIKFQYFFIEFRYFFCFIRKICCIFAVRKTIKFFEYG